MLCKDLFSKPPVPVVGPTTNVPANHTTGSTEYSTTTANHGIHIDAFFEEVYIPPISLLSILHEPSNPASKATSRIHQRPPTSNMRFTTMITGFTAAATTASAMAVPRPWIHNDVSDYRAYMAESVHPSHDTKVQKRTNNPDIHDQYPCWGCKRSETTESARDPSAMSVTIIDDDIVHPNLDERTNNPDIQDQHPCWGCKRDKTTTHPVESSPVNSDDTLEERTNNPDIQDQYPCWGCKRDETNGPATDSPVITVETTDDIALDERTNNPDIQDQYPCWGCKRKS